MYNKYKGDEVVILEPAFDIYPAQAQMAGGIPKFVPLHLDKSTGKWTLDYTELENAITPRTKILLINTPHNPTGKVLSEKELYIIRDILLRNPHVIAVCDEVYEKLVFDGHKHIRLASLPDMWQQVITVSSVGKTFSVTGWKVGWMYGAEALIYPVMLANQWVQFSVSTPTQVACAAILKQAEEPYEGYANYYEYVRDLYEIKRNFLGAALTAAHLHPNLPEGGFFIMAGRLFFFYYIITKFHKYCSSSACFLLFFWLFFIIILSYQNGILYFYILSDFFISLSCISL